ncbi:CPBP family intramembrane glutamic endopeptidase [Natronoarchaeum sp. GCM10025703]|uniref:CPBP family intramembrane glutamic endopeptidase n=1 Tax=Natronoarchaeum sp. GCM10025703 TaxID=3252685 RepID=UPI003615B47B
MTQWLVFAVVTVVVLVLVLVFARMTASLAGESGGESGEAGRALEGVDRIPDPGSESAKEPTTPPVGGVEDRPDTGPDDRGEGVPEQSGPRPRESVDLDDLSKRELFANVALTQGVFGAVLVGAAWWTGVPASALGVEQTSASIGVEAVALGTGIGLALYVANAVAALGLERVGVEFDEMLRELLAPDSLREWVVLFLFVLPTVAAFEELLFRAALIGAFSTGFGLSPWLLAAISSVAFGLGHGLQGPGESSSRGHWALFSRPPSFSREACSSW